MRHQGYQVEAIPRARATIVDALAVGVRRHMVHGFRFIRRLRDAIEMRDGDDLIPHAPEPAPARV